MDLFPSSGSHDDLYPIGDTVANTDRDLSTRQEKQIQSPKFSVVFGIRNGEQSPEMKEC